MARERGRSCLNGAGGSVLDPKWTIERGCDGFDCCGALSHPALDARPTSRRSVPARRKAVRKQVSLFDFSLFFKYLRAIHQLGLWCARRAEKMLATSVLGVLPFQHYRTNCKQDVLRRQN